MRNFNKKHKKSYNTTNNFDIEQLEKELIKKPIVYNKSSKSKSRKK